MHNFNTCQEKVTEKKIPLLIYRLGGRGLPSPRFRRPCARFYHKSTPLHIHPPYISPPKQVLKLTFPRSGRASYLVMNFLNSHLASPFIATSPAPHAHGAHRSRPTRRNMPAQSRLYNVPSVKKQLCIDFPLDAILPGSADSSANERGGRGPAPAARTLIGRLTGHMGRRRSYTAGGLRHQLAGISFSGCGRSFFPDTGTVVTRAASDI